METDIYYRARCDVSKAEAFPNFLIAIAFLMVASVFKWGSIIKEILVCFWLFWTFRGIALTCIQFNLLKRFKWPLGKDEKPISDALAKIWGDETKLASEKWATILDVVKTRLTSKDMPKPSRLLRITLERLKPEAMFNIGGSKRYEESLKKVA